MLLDFGSVFYELLCFFRHFFSIDFCIAFGMDLGPKMLLKGTVFRKTRTPFLAPFFMFFLERLPDLIFLPFFRNFMQKYRFLDPDKGSPIRCFSVKRMKKTSAAPHFTRSPCRMAPQPPPELPQTSFLLIQAPFRLLFS